eukprot:15434145-Alexandrium_andersonii.AAC.1
MKRRPRQSWRRASSSEKAADAAPRRRRRFNHWPAGRSLCDGLNGPQGKARTRQKGCSRLISISARRRSESFRKSWP